MIKNLFLLMMLCALINCSSTKSHFNKKKYAYLAADNGPLLVVPPDLNRQNISRHYIIPKAEKGQPGISTLPPDSLVAEKISQEYILATPGAAEMLMTIDNFNDLPALFVGLEFDRVWAAMPQAFKNQEMVVVDTSKELNRYVVVDPYQTGGRLAANSPRYQVFILPRRGRTVIYLVDDLGRPIEEKENIRVIKAIASGLQGKRNQSASGFFRGLFSRD